MYYLKRCSDECKYLFVLHDFADYDVICRHTEIINHGDKSIYLDKVMSFSMDLRIAIMM